MQVYFICLGDYGKLGHGNNMTMKTAKVIGGPFRNKVSMTK